MMIEVITAAIKWSLKGWNLKGLIVLLMWTAFAILTGVMIGVAVDIIRGHRYMAKWRNGWEQDRQKELPPRQEQEQEREREQPKRKRSA